MNPQDLQNARPLEDFEQNGNPFAAIMGGAQPTPQAPQEKQGGYQSIPKGMEQAAMMGGMPMVDQEDQTMKGQGVGATKFLLGAAQQLQGYIAESTERDEIMTARSILLLLTKLINRDQEVQTQKLEQTPAQVSPMGPEAGAAPQGVPANGAAGLGAIMAQLKAGQQ